MKNLIIFVTILGTFAFCLNSRATITNAYWSTASGNPLVSPSFNWNGTTSTLGIDAPQSVIPSGLQGHVQTDTAADPTLFEGAAVDNDTSFAWTGYQVNVYMSVPFTFVGSTGISNPDSTWYVASISQPSSPLLSGPYANDYEGTLDFSGGTPVPNDGSELDFNYAIKFGNLTSYTFTQEMIPSGVTSVPEPSALGLLAVGGSTLAMLWRNRCKGA